VVLGKDRLRLRQLRVRQPKKVSHHAVALRRMNRAVTTRSMAPDPMLYLRQWPCNARRKARWVMLKRTTPLRWADLM
jgi:hypothetical protein